VTIALALGVRRMGRRQALIRNLPAVDGSMNAYVCGGTNSVDFPVVGAGVDSTLQGNNDAFVTKMSPTSAIIYSTLLGGSASELSIGSTLSEDIYQRIAVDSDGFAYVTGTTGSADFPTTPGAFDTTFNGGSSSTTTAADSFITKLPQDGSTAYVFSTFIGGSLDDLCRAIALDDQNNVYVAGSTRSVNFPTVNAFQNSSANATATDEGFVAKLNSSGSQLVYSSYLGGASSDIVFGMTLDSSQGVYLVGRTGSANFPTMTTLLPKDPNNTAAFVVKLGPDNREPSADAGPDQAVDEASTVTLDGAGSSDPDTDELSFDWTQVAGPTVEIAGATTAMPTFTAPIVPVGGATLTFQLVVHDGQVPSAPDTVDINVKNVNHAPVANAGSDQSVAEDAAISLNGTDSFDPDNDPIEFSWTQADGPTVILSGANTAQPSFSAPFVGPSGATLVFQLTVSDGTLSGTDIVQVMVENINHDPIASAGPDQTRNEGTQVTLDGTLSTDPDSDSLTFTWTQTSGSSVALSDAYSASPTFTAPAVVSMASTALTFELSVDDGYGGVATDTVVITILDTNAPPACELARPSAAELWPPNHKLVPVTITGVTDPEIGTVTIRILGVTQDEPTNGLGDGDTPIDAVIQCATVLLRSERSGLANGRVYRINFEADDGVGGVCTGFVTVCVPHDRRPGAACIDDGQAFNSVGP
jgi:hypothetical protein